MNFQRSNPGDVLLTIVIHLNNFYHCVQPTEGNRRRRLKLYQNRIKVLLPPMVLASQMLVIMAIHKFTASKPRGAKLIICKN